MTAETQDPQLAVILSRLVGIDDALKEIRLENREARAAAVPVLVWEQRNKHVDSRLQQLGREIGDIRASMAASRAPWWSTWTVVLAAAGFGWSLFGPLVRG